MGVTCLRRNGSVSGQGRFKKSSEITLRSVAFLLTDMIDVCILTIKFDKSALVNRKSRLFDFEKAL